MARLARVVVPGMPHHVTQRGNRRQRVFFSADDYRAYLDLMGEWTRHYGVRVRAYCLMPNHFHLLVRAPACGDLSPWMQWLMTSHVRGHHRRCGMTEHVWQGRYKSFPVQATGVGGEARLRGVLGGGDAVLTVLRYIEPNPVRAALVASCQRWRWSSVGWLQGRRSARTLWGADE